MVSSAISAALFFLLCCCSTGAAFAVPQEHHAAAHLLTSTPDKGMVLLTIPETSAPDQAVSVHEVHPRWFLSSVARPLGVFKGHLLILQQDMVAAIDLESGTIRRLTKSNVRNAKYAGGHLHFVTSKKDESKKRIYELQHLDLAKMKTAKTCDLLLNHMASDWNYDYSMSVSQDGSRIAIAETQLGQQDEAGTGAARFRFVVCDVVRNIVMRSDYDFPGVSAVTGGYWSTLRPPQSIWSGSDSLVVADERRELIQLRVEDSSLKDGILRSETILGLPNLLLAIDMPWFFQDLYGSPGVIFNGNNRYSIDLKKEQLIEYSTLSKDYQLATSVGTNTSVGNVTLLHRNKEIDDDTLPDRVFASSPNGSRVAWLPAHHQNTRGGIWVPNNGPIKLKIHDSINGTRTIYEGAYFRFDLWVRADVPKCIWISDADLVRTDAFDKLPDLEKENLAQQKTREDVRPTIESAIALTVTTDKNIYQRHEQVHAVLEVKNLQDKPIQFETSRILGGGQELQAKFLARRGRTELNIYDRFDYQPIVKTLTIQPGKSIKLNRNFEVKYLGSQKLCLESTNSNLWKGTATAETEIEVIEETTAELAKQKFDRLMAKCLIQYKAGQKQAGASRFWQMGDEATLLLIDYLENCDDEILRESLGKGLTAGKFKTMLPYLKKLMESDLEYESKTLRDLLWRFGNNQFYFGDATFNEARKMLFEATQHRNAQVRYMFVKKMSGTFAFDDGIKEVMLRAVKDDDPRVAMIAARHLSIRSELSLANWLREAKKNPTKVNLLAAKSITEELQATWNLDHGTLPSELAALTNDMEVRQQYESTMENWSQWCDKNPRISGSYFLEARAKAEKQANR